MFEEVREAEGEDRVPEVGGVDAIVVELLQRDPVEGGVDLLRVRVRVRVRVGVRVKVRLRVSVRVRVRVRVSWPSSGATRRRAVRRRAARSTLQARRPCARARLVRG